MNNINKELAKAQMDNFESEIKKEMMDFMSWVFDVNSIEGGRIVFVRINPHAGAYTIDIAKSKKDFNENICWIEKDDGYAINIYLPEGSDLMQSKIKLIKDTYYNGKE